MFIVVADHKVVLVTDNDDVAWDSSLEMMAMGECKNAYTEEVYEHNFDKKGIYVTSEGDKITLKECQNAEHLMR